MARRSGVLIPLFSLRTPQGWGLGEIPDLVPFSRWARDAGFSLVQLLPVNQPSGGQDSPYAALTAFALDPIYFEFSAPEGLIDGQGGPSLKAARDVQVQLEGEGAYTHLGKLDFLDNAVDATTGTIRGRAVLSNAQGQLTPGQFGRVRVLEATREDAGAVALVGIDQNRVFALGWGLGSALVGLAGAIMASFFYIYPDVGASFALIAYVVVALGGFGSVFGAFAGGILVGLVEATTALVMPPSLKAVGIYAVYLLVVFIRPRGLFGSI